MEAILATDSNNGLSKEGNIPWKSSKDLQFFYKKTKNNVVIMGKNTYLSLPTNSRPLKNRLNIVLTNYPDSFLDDPDDQASNNIIFTNNSNIHLSIINHRENYHKFYPFLNSNFKIFFIGGKQIYEQFIPLCEVVWVTQLKKSYSCDLVFDFDLTKEFTEKEYYQDDEMKISTFIHNKI